jgi:hypothetical protein
MIILDLDLLCLACLPVKANAPLIVDPDAVLSVTVAF